MCVLFFFFFKQKTAYEMRISDWSSDVCSSDLLRFPWYGGESARSPVSRRLCNTGRPLPGPCACPRLGLDPRPERASFGADREARTRVQPATGAGPRSEEHTSELQSLMRISYAVFCLNKKNHRNRERR